MKIIHFLPWYSPHTLGGTELFILKIAKEQKKDGHEVEIICPNIKLEDEFDEIDGIKVIVTGSSMFDLTNQLGEPLTGRKITFQLYPIAQMEYQKEENLVKTKSNLEERLIYGSYPELLQYSSNEEKTAYLRELVSSYLLKDILEHDGIRNSGKMIDLLRLILHFI